MRFFFDSDTLPRRMAKRLKRAADASGVELKLTHAQHTIARLYGYRDWVELISLLDDPSHLAFREDAVREDGSDCEGDLIGGLSELLDVDPEVACTLYESFERLADMARNPRPTSDRFVVRTVGRRASSNGKRFFDLSQG